MNSILFEATYTLPYLWYPKNKNHQAHDIQRILMILKRVIHKGGFPTEDVFLWRFNLMQGFVTVPRVILRTGKIFRTSKGHPQLESIVNGKCQQALLEKAYKPVFLLVGALRRDVCR